MSASNLPSLLGNGTASDPAFTTVTFDPVYLVPILLFPAGFVAAYFVALYAKKARSKYEEQCAMFRKRYPIAMVIQDQLGWEEPIDYSSPDGQSFVTAIDKTIEGIKAAGFDVTKEADEVTAEVLEQVCALIRAKIALTQIQIQTGTWPNRIVRLTAAVDNIINDVRVPKDGAFVIVDDREGEATPSSPVPQSDLQAQTYSFYRQLVRKRTVNLSILLVALVVLMLSGVAFVTKDLFNIFDVIGFCMCFGFSSVALIPCLILIKEIYHWSQEASRCKGTRELDAGNNIALEVSPAADEDVDPCTDGVELVNAGGGKSNEMLAATTSVLPLPESNVSQPTKEQKM